MREINVAAVCVFLFLRKKTTCFIYKWAKRVFADLHGWEVWTLKSALLLACHIAAAESYHKQQTTRGGLMTLRGGTRNIGCEEPHVCQTSSSTSRIGLQMFNIWQNNKFWAGDGMSYFLLFWRCLLTAAPYSCLKRRQCFCEFVCVRLDTTY